MHISHSTRTKSKGRVCSWEGIIGCFELQNQSRARSCSGKSSRSPGSRDVEESTCLWLLLRSKLISLCRASSNPCTHRMLQKQKQGYAYEEGSFTQNPCPEESTHLYVPHFMQVLCTSMAQTAIDNAQTTMCCKCGCSPLYPGRMPSLTGSAHYTCGPHAATRTSAGKYLNCLVVQLG